MRSLGLLVLALAACGDDPTAVVTDGPDGSPGDDAGSLGDDVGSPGDDAGSLGDDAGPTRCATDDSCEGKCTNGTCTPPTTTDGKRSPSLGETDIDCGGPTAPPCADALACAADGDCVSKTCGTANNCVPSASCRGAGGPAGIDTCGTGEPGAAGAVVESCCRSLPLPTKPMRRLDKYEITAGRIRAFIAALASTNGGDPNVRGFAKAHAAAHPTSELGKIATGFPGLLDVLPDQKSPTANVALPIHLGAFPLDPMNSLDGCFVGPDAYGHATYWQPPADLTPFGVGYPNANPDGVRKYSREQLDAKSMNCVMPLMLAAFCAWDGGELARTSDYRDVWGRNGVTVGAATVFVPWTAIQPIGMFNWRNGHGDACPIPGWPGCVNPQPYHYRFPATGSTPANDDSAAIGAPGRFPLDVTRATSAGEGWFDIGGNLMEAAWPDGVVNPGPNAIVDVCDASAGTGGPACTRIATGRSGIRRFTGPLQQIALFGYSFEGHARRGEAYLASLDGDEAKLLPGDLKPVTFQYGKVGGRCARPGP